LPISLYIIAVNYKNNTMILKMKVILDDVVKKLFYLKESKNVYSQEHGIDHSMLSERKTIQKELFGSPASLLINSKSHN